jgi:hypothetical protein
MCGKVHRITIVKLKCQQTNILTHSLISVDILAVAARLLICVSRFYSIPISDAAGPGRSESTHICRCLATS